MKAHNPLKPLALFHNECHIPEDPYLQQQHYKNLESCNEFLIWHSGLDMGVPAVSYGYIP